MLRNIWKNHSLPHPSSYYALITVPISLYRTIHAHPVTRPKKCWSKL
ncbi:unnamed protein product [Periconia digitata]|uniref:Uncharacterized protein n=1 Tax=Periconia digitata TaxID=1303443 RepID=A0A9W4XF21_9PLEO|nr:unnamed protein product [Periconia digitata]